MEEEEEFLHTFDAAVDAVEAADGDLPLVLALRRLDVGRMNYAQRIKHWRPRAAPLIIKILRENGQAHVRETCFDILTASIKLKDSSRDDPTTEDEDTMNFAVEMGMIEVLGEELRRQPRTVNVLQACLIPNTNLCLVERYCERIIRAGVIEALIGIVQDEPNVPLQVRLLALISLTNVAIHPASHPRLIECRSMEMATGFLRYLGAQEIHQLDFGLSAGFLICRVAGRDETGVGADSIQSNELLVMRLKWILEQVLQAGPEGVVIGSR